MRKLLLVDDEVNVLHALRRTLRQALAPLELDIETFADPEQALLRAGEVAFDVVVSDYRMPGMNGGDFLGTFKLIQPDAIRLVLSATTEVAAVMDAINKGEVFRYIAKPWDADDLKAKFEQAFARHDQVIADRHLAAESHEQARQLTPQEVEAMRLEGEEPGITKVNWGDDGSVHLD
jgi:two-component system probable response regulator PhcQ